MNAQETHALVNDSDCLVYLSWYHTPLQAYSILKTIRAINTPKKLLQGKCIILTHN